MKIIPGGRSSNYLVRFGIFLIITALITGFPGSYSLDGNNNQPSENLEIQTWYDLDAVRDNLAGNHTLMNDLDSTTPGYEELASPTANDGKGWEPMGFYRDITPEIPSIGCSPPVVADVEPPWHGLTGSFDGQGHEIRDLFINRPDDSHIGLFIINWGLIKDVGVVNATVISGDWVGNLVGENIGIVSNSYSTCNTSGHNHVGGLVGENSGTVSNSYSTGNVTGNSSLGGLVGWNYWGTVSDSYSTSDVSGHSFVGGLVGFNYYGTVSNSYSTGNVSGNEDVGGLLGLNDESTVSNSFWDTETSGQTTSDGGTGKTTAEMQNLVTFSGAGWNIIGVALNQTNPAHIWNIVNNVTYPFLSWQS